MFRSSILSLLAVVLFLSCGPSSGSEAPGEENGATTETTAKREPRRVSLAGMTAAQVIQTYNGGRVNIGSVIETTVHETHGPALIDVALENERYEDIAALIEVGVVPGGAVFVAFADGVVRRYPVDEQWRVGESDGEWDLQ